MKSLKLSLRILFLCLVLSQISWANAPLAKASYHFHFALKGQALEIDVSAPSSEKAFEEAAQECFNFYSGAKGRGRVKISEEKGLSIIDACANPKG